MSEETMMSAEELRQRLVEAKKKSAALRKLCERMACWIDDNFDCCDGEAVSCPEYIATKELLAEWKKLKEAEDEKERDN